MMYQSFCECAREHHWDDKHGKIIRVLCACGRIVEPQTESEFNFRKEAHRRGLEQMALAMANSDDIEPFRFFKT